MGEIFIRHFWYVAIPMFVITWIWLISFGVSKYVKATSCQKCGKEKDKEPCIYKFSYIWWFRNLLVSCPIINNKNARKCTEGRLAQTIYLPKTSHILLFIGEIVDSILGSKTTKCK